MTSAGRDAASPEHAVHGFSTKRELRTGLVVEVPAAASVVDSHRQHLDPMAELGVPAHITVLFPFVPAKLIDGSIDAAVRSVVSQVGRFPFAVTHADWFGHEVLWLAPTATDRFVELTKKICDVFPTYKPYDGRFTGLVPHLTIADRAPIEAMHDAERQIQQHLPIRCEATSVSLILEQPSGRWTRAAIYPLS